VIIKMQGKIIVVWFSCGAASAVAVKKTIEIYGESNLIRVINNPIKEEHPDNRRFLNDIENWLGIKIESLTNRNYPESSAVDVWEKKKAMSFVKGAPCTTALKKEARHQWQKDNDADYHVMGFTSEERDRHDRWSEPTPLLPVLIDAKLSKQDCFDELARNNIKLPEVYLLGFPNANCLGCPKATSPEYWNLTRKMFPDVFAERSELSRRLGVRLVRVNGDRIFLDELDPNQKGNKLKTVKPYQCSLFC
jgi:hypothetical protein